MVNVNCCFCVPVCDQGKQKERSTEKFQTRSDHHKNIARFPPRSLCLRPYQSLSKIVLL